MPDGNDAFTLVSDTAHTDRQVGEPLRSGGTQTFELWARQRPTIVETASLIRHPAGAGDGAVAGHEPGRRSHLARLVDAVQKSRRLQAAQASRHILRLVQGERG